MKSSKFKVADIVSHRARKRNLYVVIDVRKDGSYIIHSIKIHRDCSVSLKGQRSNAAYDADLTYCSHEKAFDSPMVLAKAIDSARYRAMNKRQSRWFNKQIKRGKIVLNY